MQGRITLPLLPPSRHVSTESCGLAHQIVSGQRDVWTLECAEIYPVNQGDCWSSPRSMFFWTSWGHLRDCTPSNTENTMPGAAPKPEFFSHDSLQLAGRRSDLPVAHTCPLARLAASAARQYFGITIYHRQRVSTGFATRRCISKLHYITPQTTVGQMMTRAQLQLGSWVHNFPDQIQFIYEASRLRSPR
jgi:hypothetical protein